VYTNDEIFQNGTVVAIKSNGASVGRYVRFPGGDGAWGDLGGTAATDTACKLSIENVVKNSDGSYSCRLRSSTGYLFQGMLSIVRIKSTAVNTNQDTQVDFIPAGIDTTTGKQLFYVRTYFDKTNTDQWYGASSNKSMVDAIPGPSSGYAFWDVEAAAFLNDRDGGTLRNHDNQTRSAGKWSPAAFVPDSNGTMVNHGATLWIVEVVSISPAATAFEATINAINTTNITKTTFDGISIPAGVTVLGTTKTLYASKLSAAFDKVKDSTDKELLQSFLAVLNNTSLAPLIPADLTTPITVSGWKSTIQAKIADIDKAAAEKAAKDAAKAAEIKKVQELKISGGVKVYTPAVGSGKGVIKQQEKKTLAPTQGKIQKEQVKRK
jgi:hypothetical protein